MWKSSFRPIDRTLLGPTTTSQNGTRSSGIEGLLCIIQNFSTIGPSPSYSLVSYPGHSWREICPSEEMHIVYFRGPADLATYSDYFIMRSFEIGQHDAFILTFHKYFLKCFIFSLYFNDYFLSFLTNKIINQLRRKVFVA